MQWQNLYRGFLIGASDLIPGVSGGTVAVMLGIYDEFLGAISGFFSREWRRHLNFLLPLAIGMGAALLGLSRVVQWLLDDYNRPTNFFFLGLIVAMVPGLWRRAEARRRFRWGHFLILAAAAGSVAALVPLQAGAGQAGPIALSPATAVALFGAGALASAAMLLPGISGSFVLLVLGVYPTAIYALSAFDLGLIAVIGAGVGVGFVGSSKLISRLLERRPDAAYAAIIGLIVGSLAVIWPGLPGPDVSSTLGSVLAFALGAALTGRFGPSGPG